MWGSTFFLGTLNLLSLVRPMKILRIGLGLSKVESTAWWLWSLLYWVSCGLCRFQCTFKVPVWDDGSSGSLGQPSGHEQILVNKNLYTNKKKTKIDLRANRTLMAPSTLICIWVSKINLTRTFGIPNSNCNLWEWVQWHIFNTSLPYRLEPVACLLGRSFNVSNLQNREWK